MLRLSLDVRDPRIRRAVRRTVIAAAGPTLPIEDVSPGGEADLLIVDGAAPCGRGRNAPSCCSTSSTTARSRS